MNKNSKRFVHIFVLIILALVVIGGIGYYAYKNGQVKILKWNIPTENWKTYTNTKYYYSVKYPDDWNFKEDSNVYVYFYPKNESNYQTAISIWTTDKNTIFNPVIGGEYRIVRNILINEQKIDIKKYKKGPPDYYIKASIKNGDNTFNFRYSNHLNKKYEPYFDQILSTFKFIDQ